MRLHHEFQVGRGFRGAVRTPLARAGSHRGVLTCAISRLGGVMLPSSWVRLRARAAGMSGVDPRSRAPASRDACWLWMLVPVIGVTAIFGVRQGPAGGASRQRLLRPHDAAFGIFRYERRGPDLI
jgi:hypothetical protein